MSYAPTSCLLERGCRCFYCKPLSKAYGGVPAHAASHTHMGHAAAERSGASVRSVSAKAGPAWQGAPASRRPSHARMSTVWGQRETAHSRRSRLVVQCALAHRAYAG